MVVFRIKKKCIQMRNVSAQNGGEMQPGMQPPPVVAQFLMPTSEKNWNDPPPEWAPGFSSVEFHTYADIF